MSARCLHNVCPTNCGTDSPPPSLLVYKDCSKKKKKKKIVQRNVKVGFGKKLNCQREFNARKKNVTELRIFACAAVLHRVAFPPPPQIWMNRGSESIEPVKMNS